jgi:hypothetical protein
LPSREYRLESRDLESIGCNNEFTELLERHIMLSNVGVESLSTFDTEQGLQTTAT